MKIQFTVSKKGVLTLISFSEKHGRGDLSTYLNESIRTTPISNVLVHTKCRRYLLTKRESTAMWMLLKFPFKKTKV